MIAVIQNALNLFLVHPFMYSYGFLTALGVVLNSVAPNSRITKAVVAIAGNLAKVWNLLVSLSTDKTLAAALVLAGKLDATVTPVLNVTSMPVATDLAKDAVIVVKNPTELPVQPVVTPVATHYEPVTPTKTPVVEPVVAPVEPSIPVVAAQAPVVTVAEVGPVTVTPPVVPEVVKATV